MLVPGWVREGGCVSSVSSAWQHMPLAIAALGADVTIRLPMTLASGLPPCAFIYFSARLPGSKREPEIIAAKASTRWTCARSFTSCGKGLLMASAM
jgi:hypothetical protein